MSSLIYNNRSVIEREYLVRNIGLYGKFPFNGFEIHQFHSIQALLRVGSFYLFVYYSKYCLTSLFNDHFQHHSMLFNYWSYVKDIYFSISFENIQISNIKELWIINRQGLIKINISTLLDRYVYSKFYSTQNIRPKKNRSLTVLFKISKNKFRFGI